MPSPFYTTTPRYALRSLLGTSNVSDTDAGFLAALTDVENTFTGYKSGTHAARLAATALDGLLWRETDTGLMYVGTGTAWLPVGPGGAWTALTLASGWATYTGNGGYYTPSARIVGDRVELKGAATNAGATSPAATLPSSAFAPVSAVRFAQPGGSSYLTIAAGTTSILTTGAPTIVYFDGLSYSLT